MRRLLPVLLCFLALGAQAVEPVSKTLPNGLRLVTLPAPGSALVSIEVLVDCSAIDEVFTIQTDDVAISGLRQVLLMSMLQGSKSTDGDTIRRTLAAAGGFIVGRVQQDAIEFSVTVPADKIEVGLSALAEIICRPQLSDTAVKNAVAQAKRTMENRPGGIIDIATALSYESLFYGHPYAMRGQCTPETLKVMTPELIQYIYPYYIVPEKTVIAVVGKCETGSVQAQLEKAFATWPHGKDAFPRKTVDPIPLDKSEVTLREAPVQSTCVMMSFPVCGATHPDFVTLRVIDTLLGGGTGSRLFRNVREQQRLAYEVATQLADQQNCSYFSLYALTHSRYLDDTKTALAHEITRLQETPVSPEELQHAKAYLKGRMLLANQSSAQHAYNLAWNVMTGLGANYENNLTARIDAVTPAEIQRVAQAYLTRYFLIVVVPPAVAQQEE